ncbi:MAG: FKBP-type peptidyl-prolyl cis-trans isomerase [Cyclobacteriaceae bacterium]
MKKSFGLILAVVAFLLASCLKQDVPSGPTFDEQLKKDIVTIDDYLTSNGINAVKDSSGVRYLVTKVGSGKKPRIDSIVYLNYKSTVMSNGKLFLDTKDASIGAILRDPNSSFYCWQLILPKLNRGSSVTIYSPSGYAYGTGSSSDGSTLPANSNMIFDIKILDEVEQFKVDTTAIEAYLATNNLTATTDPSGLRYVITELGTGAKPRATSAITFNYDGKFLTSGTSFDKSAAPVSSALSNLIKGFQIGMPLLPAGSKATFYIPSSLGYGPFGSPGKIPSNSNLIFDVELVSTN